MSTPERELEINGGRFIAGLNVPPSVWTHSGFRAWLLSEDFPDEGLRATFINGEVLLDMSPDELDSHNLVRTRVASTLDRLVDNEDLGHFYSDRALLSHPDARLSCEPDAVFISWSALESGRVRRVEQVRRKDHHVEIVGTPDMVLEVVSNSSVRKDMKLLRAAYHRAGIPEYWLIDARGEAIHFEILHHTDTAYHASAAADQPQESRVFERTFSLTRTRDRIGSFRYKLSILPR